MIIRLNLHETTFYRWVGVLEGIISVLLTIRFSWPVALGMFILIRFVDTQLLLIFMAALEKLAAKTNKV